MERFWPIAARILKPGGSVAIWTPGKIVFDPSMPQFPAIQAALERHEESLKEYMEPGNHLARDLYANLPMPWTLREPVLQFK